MMSVNLEKTFEYHAIQESLRCENFAEYYLCIKQYFDMFFSTRKHLTNKK